MIVASKEKKLTPLSANGEVLASKLQGDSVRLTPRIGGSEAPKSPEQLDSLQSIFLDEVCSQTYFFEANNQPEALLEVSLLPEQDSELKWVLVDRTDEAVKRFVEAQLTLYASVGMVTGQIAHDFNNLIGAADGAVSLLKRNATDDEKAARRLELLSQSLSRAAVLSNELGLLVPKAERQMSAIGGDDFVSLLEECLLARLCNDLSIAADAKERLSSVKCLANPAITRGLLFGAISLLPKDSNVTCELSLTELDQDEIKGLGGELRGGSFLQVSMNVAEDSEWSKAVTRALQFIDSRLAEELSPLVFPPGSSLSQESIAQLLALHQGVWKMKVDSSVVGIEIYLPVSGS